MTKPFTASRHVLAALAVALLAGCGGDEEAERPEAPSGEGARLIGAWSAVPPEGEEGESFIEFAQDGAFAAVFRIDPDAEAFGQLGTWELVSGEGDEFVVRTNLGGQDDVVTVVFEGDDRITASAEGEDPLTLVRSDEAAEAIAQARDEGVFEGPGPNADRRGGSAELCTINLELIMFAMYDYHDQHDGHLPADSYDDEGNPLLSWRVHLLPFLEEQALYEQFHLDEPWDSQHNRALLAQIPPLYQCPAAESEWGTTSYVRVAGEQTLFPPGGEMVGMADISDDVPWTIAVVEVSDAHAVPWTQPRDLSFDDVTTELLVGHHERGFHAVFADGTVHFLPAEADAGDLRALLTRNGGEAVSPDDL